MKVKKFIATNMAEAMHSIRSELGEDAVILHSKKVDTGGFLGMFTKKKLEVIAAIDPLGSQPKSKALTPASRLKQQPKQAKQLNVSTENQQLSMKNEIKQLKTLISEMEPKSKNDLEYPRPFQEVENHLAGQGVLKSARVVIIKQLMKDWYENEEKDFQLKVDYSSILKTLFANLSFGQPFHKKIVNIVGPTGVGKTTTIAKLAAIATLQEEKKVALITTDTFRISAVEQLKTYAKILNIPVKVAYSIDDFKKGIDMYSHYDLILVDSAGRNFRNSLYVEELSKVMNFDQDTETHLVLSLTSKYEDMKAIIEQFNLISISSVILTKKDETSTHGAMVNIPFEYNIPLTYVTTGQNVPDDIMTASIELIASSINGRAKDE
ncbi:flagellar biosynthesis protein FlhF [Halalkalibacter hemicellulosilyticus]|uniref:Flagellar biosynthesis protein FlhF n=1 Tax=Halalkalibacter hemicellulosilyticusJCM 9152 TaxID=1236971 RepID=W4QD07_9BACI|nr:flagellar biosynthesis protein FlhF [Halalkalibacter hemicellulosilyticus]GAE29264.1 flagellar biosynthesis protein FlhF [Halalkalibacter hemicellulosilyticusJCM 9152]